MTMPGSCPKRTGDGITVEMRSTATCGDRRQTDAERMKKGTEPMNERNDVMEIDLRDLAVMVLRRWWLILVCAVLAAGSAYVYTKQMMTPLYQAGNMVFLGKEDTRIPMDLITVEVNNQLIIDYRELLRTKMVSREVISQLNLDVPEDVIRGGVSVSTISDSRMFSITFTSPDPEFAAKVVNQLADVLVVKAKEIIQVDNVVVIDRAEVPTSPISPNARRNTMMAGLLGVMAALGLIFLLEFLDRTFKKSEELERKLGLPVLGEVPEFEGEPRISKKKRAKQPAVLPKTLSRNLVSHLHPKSAASEAYRSIRTNLHYAGVDRPLKSLVVTSPTIADGKSTTASNIAVSMAQAGSRVLLLDGDLRKPKLHRYFGLANAHGLTSMLVDEKTVDEVVQSVEGMPNLSVITSGPIPPNPSELLLSEKLKHTLEALTERFDFVVMDSPPAAQVTDSAILSKMADGVLLVVSAGETAIDATFHAVKALQAVQARIVGTLLVKVSYEKSKYYYYA